MGICDSTPEGKLPAGWLELFDALKLTRKEITQLQKIFRKVDLDGSGSVDTVELLTLLDIERTRFTEQIFALFDSDGSGKVDFREWVISLWNYCTIGEAGLDIFTFDLYDSDSSGVLSPGEVSQMLKDIYGKHHVNDAKVKLVDQELHKIDSRTPINLPAFRKFTKTHQALLFPVFQLQNQLQKKVLGVAFWHKASNRRIEICKGNYITMSTLMEMHLNKGLYERAVSDSNFLRMSSNARLVIKTTGTTHGRQQVEGVKQEKERRNSMGSIGSVGSAGSASTNPKAGTTAPPQPLAYGSFTAADKQAAIDNVKPAASKKGVFSNKQREKQAGGAKTLQVETLHEDVVVGGTKPKPHSEGLPPRRRSVTPAD